MDTTQIGVARGMASALLTAVAGFTAVTLVSRAWNLGTDLTSRITLAAWALLSPAATLFLCIARLAKHRFFTPEDIHGSALTSGTDKARVLQSLLQNTLEQCCLAFPVYVAGTIIAPPFILPVVPAATFVGRMLFFAGYAKGAPARAYGFALTFYPTVLLLVLLLAIGALRSVT
jgi:MAPEG family protein